MSRIDIVDLLREVDAPICDKGAAEIQRLRTERDALLKDAHRYRWLRKNCYKPRSVNEDFDSSMLLSFIVSGVWKDNRDPAVLDGCIDYRINAELARSTTPP